MDTNRTGQQRQSGKSGYQAESNVALGALKREPRIVPCLLKYKIQQEKIYSYMAIGVVLF